MLVVVVEGGSLGGLLVVGPSILQLCSMHLKTSWMNWIILVVKSETL